MGLTGLACFLVVMATLLAWGFRHRRAVFQTGLAELGTQRGDASAGSARAGAEAAPSPAAAASVGPPVDVPALWLGVHAGLVAALAVGVLDHYFFRLSFQSAGTLFWLFAGLCLAATRLSVMRTPSSGV
jgi:hypothetical protein